MALTLQDVDEIIDNSKPELMRRLDFSIFLQAELKRVDVITESVMDQLQVPILTPHQKINILLDGLRTGPVERFLTFCQTLHTEGQGHLLQVMGVDIREIEKQAGTLPDDTKKQGLHQRLIRRGVYKGFRRNAQQLSLPGPLTDSPTQGTTATETDLRVRTYMVIVQETEAAKRCNLKINTRGTLSLLSDCLYLWAGPILKWNYKHIRWFSRGKNTFTFEAGRRSLSEEGVFLFLVPSQAEQLYCDMYELMKNLKKEETIKQRSRVNEGLSARGYTKTQVSGQ